MTNSSLRNLWALLRPHLAPRWGTFLLVVALSTISALGQKAPIVLLDPLWTRVFSYEGDAPAPSGLRAGLTELLFGPAPAGEPSADDKLHALYITAVLLACVALITAAAEYATTWLSRRLALHLVIDLRQRLARHLLGLSLRYHGDRRFGDLLSRVASDVTTTLHTVNTSLNEVLQGPLLVLASLAVAALAAPWPTLCVVLFLPVLALPIALLGGKVRRRSQKSLSSLGESVQVLTQMIQGIRTVKAFRAEERELERFRAANDEYASNTMRMVRAMARTEAATALLSTLGIALLVVAVGWIELTWQVFGSGGVMAQFFVGISLIYSHVKRTTNALSRVQESAGAADRLQELFAEPIDVKEAPGAAPIDGLGTGVAFESVGFRYPGAERDAVSDLSLHIRPGETLALVGPSGAGKSTCIDLIARFMDVARGRITVDGRDLRSLSIASWTEQYAMVGQVPFLFHASVLENIRYGKPACSLAEVHAAARAANIHEFVLSLPQGYDTVVGDQGARLSGGQRQRITIARAILKGAPLLLLDEATSALDSESEAVVQQALDRLMKDKTVIVIAHRLSTVRNATRIAVLDGGRMVELGTHAELASKGGLYARLAAVQFHTPLEVTA